MKPYAQYVLLIALLAALGVTYFPALREMDEPTPGTGPITEPHPITLRMCAKEVVVRAVIDDGLSLLDAAALCREVYRLFPDPSGLIYPAVDESTDGTPLTEEERFCRQVIAWTQCRRHADGIEDRLEAEFRVWHCHGTGRLPAPIVFPAELRELARAEWVAESTGQRDSRMSLTGGFTGCE
jgi:hypothetical protein